MRIVLVACCSGKLQYPSAAKDLYISPLFKKSRAWAEKQGCPWYILSALHGLVDPEAQLRPYDDALTTKGVREKQAWAYKAWKSLDGMVSPGDEVVMLAGTDYTRYLRVALERKGVTVTDPLQGLSIGRRLQLLNSLI